MSVLEDVLEEEYARSSRLLGLMEQEISLLPKGSIRMRNIKGHEYCYLNYRVGDKVKSDYVPATKVDELQAKIERRRALAAAIGSVEKVGVEPDPKRVGPASWNLEHG